MYEVYEFKTEGERIQVYNIMLEEFGPGGVKLYPHKRIKLTCSFNQMERAKQILYKSDFLKTLPENVTELFNKGY